MPKLRVAVIAMDSLEDYDVAEEHKTYQSLYTLWFKKFNMDASFETFNLWQKNELPPDVSRFDLFLLTGSRCSAYENIPWINSAKDFVRKLDKEGRKVVGICFGHQLVAEALDGKVEKNPNGWEVGWADFSLTTEAAQVLNADPKKSIDLYYTHQDAVTKIPPGFISLGGNAATAIQGMAKGHQFITFQGHPEFNREVMTTLLKLRESRWSEEFVHHAWESIKKDPNEVLVLERALNYLGLLPKSTSN